MEHKIELDESRALDIQQKSLKMAADASTAIEELREATSTKTFGPLGDQLCGDVEKYGIALATALEGWENEETGFIGPVVKAANGVWKMLCNRRAAISDPLKERKQAAALAVGAYRAARRRDKEEKEEAARRLLQKEAEDKRLAEAAELEKNGKVEQAQELIDAPVYTPPVVFADAPKIKGAREQVNWKFKITDAALIPRKYLIPDERIIGAVVRAEKDKTAIPGVEVYAEEKAAFSNRG